MRFSAKAMAIGVGIALIAGVLLGFIPEYTRSSAATKDKNNVESQLAVVQRQATLSDFKVRAASIYTQAEMSNFSSASGSASSFFTDLQKYYDQYSDSGLKLQLQAVLSQRDIIVAGLAKADPAVAGQLQGLFLKMKSIEPTHDATAGL
jgi:hypothetical protein